MKKIQGELVTVDMPLTYTTKEVAELLHTNVARVSGLIKAGKLRAIKPTGTTLIYRKSLIEFVEKWEGYNLRDPYNPTKIITDAGDNYGI